MHRISCLTIFCITLAVAGCIQKPARMKKRLGYSPEPTTFQYTEPEESHLSAIRPYPNANDACVKLRKNYLTSQLKAYYPVLIACPKHEKGAISDRLREGATIVDHVEHWSLLSVPVQVFGFSPEPTLSFYTRPELSKLNAIRPYPNDDDLCMTLHKNSVTRKLVSDNAMLIGCPKHEKGEISNRLREGATVIAHARHWSVLSVPNRGFDSNTLPTTLEGTQSKPSARN